MTNKENFFKTPAAEEFLSEFRLELQKAQKPPEQQIYDEVDFCQFLKISKRHAANLRASRAITYSKSGGKLYYKLSDILDFINKNEIKSIDRPGNIFKFKKPRK